MNHRSAIELHDAFLEGKITAVEIVEDHLKRISQSDPKLHAFLAVFGDRALERAKALDEKKNQGKPLGKLAGIPIALKDNIHVKDEFTTCGSKILKNYRAPFDSTVTKLIESEDGIIIGKTNLDEFAMGSSMENSAFGVSRNPWALDCSPGGSSGGSAVAVSAGMCPIALGSETGGSVRQPAAFCGLVGLKPSYGRVSRYGLVAFGSSLDQISAFANNVKDTALIMDVIGKHCDHDSTSVASPNFSNLEACGKPIEQSTIGVPWAFLENLDPEMEKNFKESLKVFENLGVKVVELKLPIFKYSIATYYILSTAEASTNLARFDGIRYGLRSSNARSLDDIYDLSRDEGFGPEVKNRILLGTFVLSSGHMDDFYRKAQQVRTLFIEQCREAFAKCDMIAFPTTPSAAFKFGEIKSVVDMYLQDIFTTPANLAGLPAMNVPSGITHDGKPMGLQLMGPQLQEDKVFQFAHAFETARGPFATPPEVL